MSPGTFLPAGGNGLRGTTVNRMRPPEKRMRVVNFLTPPGSFGENQEVR